MQYKENADVYTSSEEKVGTVERVVLNPVTKKVTHIIVEKGFLFTEDTIIPINYIKQTSEDRIVLSEDLDDFDDLPPYIEHHYIAPDEEEYRDVLPPYHPAPMYYYGPVSLWQQRFGFIDPDAPRYVATTEKHTPENTVVIEIGADVISRDSDKVGEVERVITDKETSHATHLVIADGFLFKERKVIPTTWIKNIIDDGSIYLTTGSKLLNELPELEEDAIS